MFGVSIATSALAAAFAVDLLRRWLRNHQRRHLLWWAAGVAAYGLGTLAAAVIERSGWSPGWFRIWYIAGAILGGALLAQGTVYLLHRAETADRLAQSVGVVAVGAAGALLLAPIAPLDSGDLAGRSIEWAWVRAFTPVLNVYAVVYLVGGAIWSAVRLHRRGEGSGRRVAGNWFIAVGGLTPAAGGLASRLGGADALPPTLLAGLILIWIGAVLAARNPGVRSQGSGHR
ncbi:MAG TPA: hypothetical protein DCY40_05395 [Actinobacteria bacterium]|nr:hypothetical protein [Actinomycetota bacterium]